MSIQYVLRTENSKFNYTPTYFQGMKNVMVFVSVDFDKVKVEDGWSYMKDDDYMNKTIRFIKDVVKAEKARQLDLLKLR